ncbi:MAG: DUF4157 domain-containing protein [Nannocystaceae bacterium]
MHATRRAQRTRERGEERRRCGADGRALALHPATSPVPSDTFEDNAATIQRLFAGPSAALQGADAGSPSVAAIAREGVASASSAYPHRAAIQRLFGRHSLGTVRAHRGGRAAAAARSIGAAAYATGEHVAFDGAPSLRTAAHEAAHVVQQRRGVVASGVGRRGDVHERHAEAVAEAVVRGRDAERILDAAPRAGASAAPRGDAIQRITPEEAREDARKVRDLRTWDPNVGYTQRGGWVTPIGARGRVTRRNKRHQLVDERQITGLKVGSFRQETERFRDLSRGQLNLDELHALSEETAKRIDPRSDAPRNILRGALASSWTFAKHELAGPHSTRADKTIMKRLWEFREHDHERVLQRTKAEVNRQHGSDRGLTGWSAAGSTSLTSDIDVNLKGEATELAVAEFNRQFTQVDHWPYEAGVVYDVNCYALDFMHAPRGVDRPGPGPGRLVGEEGKREGRPQGGIADAALRAVDIANQEEWSLLKVRLYMTEAQWRSYKQSVDPLDQRNATWTHVEAKYTRYRQAIVDEMKAQTGSRLPLPPRAGQTGSESVHSAASRLVGGGGVRYVREAQIEDLIIGASNRLYERKLQDVARLRRQLRTRIDWYEHALRGGHARAARRLEYEVDRLVVELRDSLSDAALYSNEAYLTSGAVNHTVVGLQIGAGITQTKASALQAVNENLGDSLKEMSRHGGSLGEAAMKAGKYMWRLADAALDMGVRTHAVRSLYTAGYEIANVIKKDARGDKEGRAAAKIAGELGIVDRTRRGVLLLKRKVIEIATGVSGRYDAHHRANNAEVLGAPITNQRRRRL